MNIWLHELSDMIVSLLGNPRSLTEYVVLLVLTLLVLFLAMYMVGSATRIPNLGSLRRLFALVLGIGCMMCVWVGTLTYLLPYVETALLRQAVMIGVPVVACLLVVIPIQQAIFRSTYVATLITFVSSLALAALFVILANAVLGAIQEGENESGTIKNRKDALNQILDQ